MPIYTIFRLGIGEGRGPVLQYKSKCQEDKEMGTNICDMPALHIALTALHIFSH